MAAHPGRALAAGAGRRGRLEPARAQRRALQVMGEWDGRELRPLSAWRGEDAAHNWSLAA
nr:hypothetical protein [Lysobacter enzymogenes]